MQSNTFEIRDLRQTDWVWTSKAVLFDHRVSASAYKVYCGLSSYAGNEDQKAFPGIETLAKRLHLGRNTIMRNLDDLESAGLIRREKTPGQHNVYYLLSVGDAPQSAPRKRAKKKEEATVKTDAPTPKETARLFFDGIVTLMQGGEVPWLQEMLRAIAEKNGVQKKVVWDQVREFGAYWTEKNASGAKERWELEKTFEVQLRLATWFRRAKVLPSNAPFRSPSKAKGIIGLTPIPA